MIAVNFLAGLLINFTQPEPEALWCQSADVLHTKSSIENSFLFVDFLVFPVNVTLATIYLLILIQPGCVLIRRERMALSSFQFAAHTRVPITHVCIQGFAKIILQ